MRIALSTLALLVAGVGCARDLPVADVAAGVPPLNGLAAIRLGMRADELVRARPGVKVASYYGYEEPLPHSSISYEVPGSVNDGQAPPAGEHLESVTFFDSLAATPDPFLQWGAKVRDVTAVTGTAPTCYRLHWASVTAWMAVWRRGGGELFVLGQPVVTDPRGRVTPPALRVGVVRRGRAVAHTNTPAEKTDCWQLL